MDEFQTHYPFSHCRKDIHEDLIFYGGKTGLTKFWVFFFSIPFKLMFWYRLSRYFHLKDGKPVPFFSLIKYRQATLGGNEINYKAQIGRRIQLPHPFGIVIGSDTIIDDDVTIFQQVTFGSHGRKNEIKKYPKIHSGSIIYSGAKIIGGVTIGYNAIVGANSVVLQDVPDNTVVVGIPAKVKNG